MSSLLPFLFLLLCTYFSSGSEEQNECLAIQTPLARSITTFSSSLFTKLSSNTRNVFYSPASISTALSMAYLGSRGITARQMETVLGFHNERISGVEVHKAFHELILSAQRPGEGILLEYANEIFVQRYFDLRADFTDNLEYYYLTSSQTVDFAFKGDEALEQINNWVNISTHGKITKLLSEPLSRLSRIVIVNAVYFKGTWQLQFKKSDTSRKPFFKLDGSEKIVDMMLHYGQQLLFLDDSDLGYKFLELPYEGEYISMLFALPQQMNASADLRMDADLLCSILSNLKDQTVVASIPKFKIAFRKTLQNVLADLGMTNLFSSKANLRGMREDNDISLNFVIHKAMVEVNEEGSEAAAATGLGLGRKKIEVPLFIADHPFQFYIIDKRSESILFAGQVNDP